MRTKAKTGMKRGRTPWTAKLRPDMQPALVEDPKGGGKMLLPTPTLVADAIGRIPRGALTTVSALRSGLAQRHGADVTCPLMTGIFYNLIAGAAEEQLGAGMAALAPYWRVVRDDGSLSPKTPEGPERQADRLRLEGHSLRQQGGRLRVEDFERHLVS